MGATTKDFCGFGTGGIEESQAVLNTSVGTSPAPPSSKETYTLAFTLGPSTGRAQYSSAATTTTATHWHTAGFHVRFASGIDGNADMDFFRLCGSSGDILSLNISGANGDLRLKDNSGTVRATYASAFAHNTWYRIEVKVRSVSLSDCKVFLDGVEVISHNGAFSAGSNVFLRFLGPAFNPSSTADVSPAIANYYLITDDGAGIGTNNTYVGNFSVVGPYHDTNNTSQTADFGNPLNSGTWANMTDVPRNDTTRGRYTGVGAIGSGGGCTANDGARPGPKDDSRVDGTIKGAKWIWRARKQGFGTQNLVAKYGAHTVPTTDNCTDTATFVLSTAYTNFHKVVDSSDPDCPTTNEWIQYGIKKTNSGPAAPSLDVSEIWSFILHKEPVAARIRRPSPRWQRPRRIIQA